MPSTKFLPKPPESLPDPNVPTNAQEEKAGYLTPPPSPRYVSPSAQFEHWGLLKPLNAYSPYLDFFCSRKQRTYVVGGSKADGADFVAPILMITPFCVITWDGTDSPDSVQFTSKFRVTPDIPNPPELGIFHNYRMMELGETCVLRHGDVLDFAAIHERYHPGQEFRFVWLQCTTRGWLPLEYTQYHCGWLDSDLPIYSDHYSTGRAVPVAYARWLKSRS